MKKWYESKVVWTGILIIATAAMESLVKGADLRQLGIAVLGALVVYFRFITTQIIK